MTDPAAQAASTAPLIVGVVGAGTMGAGIAQVCLQAGHEVLLYDVDEAAIERGRQRIGDGLGRLVAKGKLTGADAGAMEKRIRDAHTLSAIAEESDLVIEAALEQLELKRTIFAALDAGARADVLLATNTSALSVTAVAAAARRPERVVGLHFFNPAPVMPLVEVVSGDQTARAVVEQAGDFVQGIGKTPVVCRDSPGFIVNRVNRPFTLEALRLVEAGRATVEDIDHAVEAAGYPMGPFRLMDLVGIDVNLAVAKSLYEAFDQAERFKPSDTQQFMVDGEALGRKSGHGFYRYDDRGALLGPNLDSRGRDGNVMDDRLTDAEMVQRIEFSIINEAYHAVGDQVAQPPEIDKAMKLGANHPYGPFERAGQVGLRAIVQELLHLERFEGPRYRVAPALWQVAAL